ncbi:hypothetical protein DEO72_LG8g9 [Vigna unguiculata]|nr:hypothetical protein DEO72_LG8g9 [Vigna unguiculata]
MSPEEVSALNTLNRLPRKLPTRKLLKAYKSPRLREELYDIMTSMNPNSKAYFKQMFQKFVPPSAEKAEESPVVVITEAIPIQQVFAASSGLSPRDGKKRKEDKSSRRHHDHGKKLSSPKRVSGETSAPLGGGIFGVELRLGNKLSFDLNGAEKEFYKGLSFGEAVEAIMELNARAALLCRTLCLDGEKVHSELADSRHELGEALKANSILNAQVKEAVSAHAACAETKTVLSSEIDSLKVEEKRLKDEVLRLQRSVDDHTLGRQRDKEERDELVKELEDAQRFVFEQHQLGFQKALNQAKFFYDIPLNEGNFDVGKDFYKGKLIPIAEIVDDDATQLVQPVKVEGATY